MGYQHDKEITPGELARRLMNGENLRILDVREPAEWAEGHIEGAAHIPLGQLVERLSEIDQSQEVYVVCRSGGRSSLACELLMEKGYNVVNVIGGMNAWQGKLV